MKKPLIHRIVARLALSAPRGNRGVAILTVLAIITLMTVLVISFFNMATTAKTTAKGSVEIQRATTLKDTIINLVVAQFREASRLEPANPSRPREIVTWTSQPGAIRTYSGSDASRNRLYKLYSSSVPQIESIQPKGTLTLLEEINKDNAPDWAERPDEFTDLNRPVYTAATGDRARATGANDTTGYSFPIVDPRSYNGRAGVGDLARNTEGFSYSDKSGSLRIRGIDPTKEQLAMPVRWIYLLRDGTLGFMDEGKEFKSLTGSGEATRTNPIVGRLAWWADDESCKINVNTASIPSIWDTPRTTSKEDQWLARNQPIAREFQRYPGHPATVDLSAVFYPNRRFVPTELTSILGKDTAAGGAMTLLPVKDARRIWDLAPFIVGDQNELKAGSVGTGGGEYPTPRDAAVGLSKDDHLFTSMDEVYFKASGASNKSSNAPRSSLLSENKDENFTFLKTLERSQFFLTTKSNSPELTNVGFPRVSMYPMDMDAIRYIGTTGALDPNVSPYDVTMALNSTVGGKPKTASTTGGNAYFFQRQDSTSRHNEFYNASTSAQRNAAIMKYLKELSKLPIPGYPDTEPFKVASALAEDPNGLTFASKYPAGLNQAANKVWGNVGGATGLHDASDRTQILLNMLDYTRSINTNSAFVTQGNRYDGGYGGSAGICGCAQAVGASTNETHSASLDYGTKTTRTPKGNGKLYGAAEIAVVINIAARRDGAEAAGASTRWGDVYGRMSNASKARADDKKKPGIRYLVEVGFMASGFSPKHGWSPTFAQTGVSINTISGATLPLTGDGEKLGVATEAGNTSRLLPRNSSSTGVIPIGGMGGPRALFPQNSNGFAMAQPYCLILPPVHIPTAIEIKLSNPGNVPIRIMMGDGPGSGNVVQAIDLVLPQEFFDKATAPWFATNDSLSNLAPRYAKGELPFPPPPATTPLIIKSFVVPHGDFRLTTTPSRIDGDVFVPHEDAILAGTGGMKMGHSFYELNSVPDKRAMEGAKFSPHALIDTALVSQYRNPDTTSHRSSLTGLPIGRADSSSKGMKSVLKLGNDPAFAAQDPRLETQASKNPSRREIFSYGRRDGRRIVPNRGSSDPTETGDWDTGVGALSDGPYMNYPDEGDRRSNMDEAYFRNLAFTAPKPTSQGIAAQNVSPNFLIRSPVDFGSVPTGLMSRVPWQTLRFRPDKGMNDPGLRMKNIDDVPPAGLPFANFCGPRDHFFLDMFWMPVVEPWSISEPFSTKGTINLNQQLYPFTYIERTTALHALMRGERMMAIPNSAAENYKSVSPATGVPNNQDPSYRHFINARETMRQFTRRYNEGVDMEGNTLAFNSFRSASEICEIWLAPEGPSSSSPVTLENVINTYWSQHLLTGDNLRERPYANLYPRVTVRSNVFKLHMVAQTLQKATSEAPSTFNSIKDSVTAEWRGSCMIERSIDPRDPLLTDKDYTRLNSLTLDNRATPKLDRYYTYRVTEVKQLTQ